ncbi:MAG: hypothetical protein ACOYJC_06075 [Christensenellales bacterium]
MPRFFSLLLVVALLFQVFGLQPALAAPPQNLTGADDYLVIHTTTGSYPDTIGGPSTITVTAPDGELITASEGKYSGVPAGSTLNLKYVFHLEDGDGGSYYEYDGGSYFTFALPDGLTFTAPSDEEAKVMANDSIKGLWQMAT